MNENYWETVGTGNSTIENDSLTLQSNTGGAYAFRRYVWTQPRWNGPREVGVLGDVELRFRFNGYSKNAASFVVLETGYTSPRIVRFQDCCSGYSNWTKQQPYR